MLGIFAGSDTVSAALVVGAFLMGLGLGSLAGAKLADRLPPARALAGFALCEAGVAGFALLSKPFLYDLLAVGLAGVVDAPAAVFALCFAGLVLPTTLMGASLPLLARAVATSLDTVAERIGWLYGLNTLGAGAGALVGGWLLVGNLGFVGSLAVAAALNLGAAALAMGLRPSVRRAPAPVLAPPRHDPAERAPFGGLRLWCLLVCVSGYVVVALEVLWIRLLGQLGHHHAYLFPTILGFFLLADGAGMAVGARLLSHVRDPRPAFFMAQGAAFALAAALVLCLWWALPYWPLKNHLVWVDELLGGGSLLATVVLTVLVVGPPSFLYGLTFPLVQRAVQQDFTAVGARVGWVQVANILGNAAGSLATGLASLHVFGTAGTLRLLAAVSLALLLGWLWHSRRRTRTPELALAAVCAGTLALVPSNATFWRRMHGLGPTASATWAEDRSGVALYHPRTLEAGTGPLFIMGYPQGQIPFMPFHMALGAVGPLLHPNPQRMLVIGVGSGGTPWGALVSAKTQEVRGVELVGPVLAVLGDVARQDPQSPAAALLGDPRMHFVHGDGRRLLAASPELYDVIEADAIRPDSSRSGMLYSREFMEQVRRRLAPGGLFVQWAPTWRVVTTFAAVFPHTVLLLGPGHILVGSNRPIHVDLGALAQRLRDPAALAHFRRGNPGAADLTPFVAERVLVWEPGDRREPAPLTDMFPRDEFFLNNRVDATWRRRAPPPHIGGRADTRRTVE
jgi:hypothetical protein